MLLFSDPPFTLTVGVEAHPRAAREIRFEIRPFDLCKLLRSTSTARAGLSISRHNPARTAGQNGGVRRPDRARFADYPVLDNGRGKTE